MNGQATQGSQLPSDKQGCNISNKNSTTKNSSFPGYFLNRAESPY
jgi:hypothetical protein